MTPRALLAAVLLALPLLAAVPTASAVSYSHLLVVDVQPDTSEAITFRVSHDGPAVTTEYASLCLVDGAVVEHVKDADGKDVAYNLVASRPKPILSLKTDATSFTVTMTRGAAEREIAPLYRRDVNPCVLAGGSYRAEIRVPEGFVLFAGDRGSAIDLPKRSLVDEGTGAFALSYAYEAPLPSPAPLVAFDSGPFRVIAPTNDVDAARTLAETAAPFVAAAAAEAGLEMPWSPLYVRFAPDADFGWEAGTYTGDGIVALKASALVQDANEGWPWTGVETLVHEAFHAMSVPYNEGSTFDSVQWWVEGTADNAESVVIEKHPEAGGFCETEGLTTRCRTFDGRLSMGALAAFYARGDAFDTDWDPQDEQPEETRSFYYAYGGFLAGAYVARYGADAYQAVWDEIMQATADPASCPCDSGWLAALLVESSDGATASEVLYPWKDLFHKDRAAWEAAVRPFLQAPFDAADHLPEQPSGGGGILGGGGGGAAGGGAIPSPAPLAALALALGVALALRGARAPK